MEVRGGRRCQDGGEGDGDGELGVGVGGILFGGGLVGWRWMGWEKVPAHAKTSSEQP